MENGVEGVSGEDPLRVNGRLDLGPPAPGVSAPGSFPATKVRWSSGFRLDSGLSSS